MWITSSAVIFPLKRGVILSMKRLTGLLLILVFLPVTAFGLSSTASTSFTTFTTFTEFTSRLRLELPLAEGVVYQQIDLTPTNRSAGMSQRVHLLDVHPEDNPYLRVSNILGAGKIHDNLTMTSAMVKTSLNTLPGAFLGAVNGDFFDEGNGGPVGCNMEDGEWLTLGEFYNGWAVGFTRDAQMIVGRPNPALTLSVQRGSMLILDHYPISAPNAPRLDRAEKSIPMNVVEERKDNALVLYTPRYEASTFTSGGTDFLIETSGIIRTHQTVTGVIREAFGAGGRAENTNRKGLPLGNGTMVLSALGEAAEKLSFLQPGDRVYITCHADPVFDEASVISGGGRPDYGPLLLLDGKKADIDQVQELDERKEYFYSHHARTIAARRADGSWFFLVIEGYRSGSYGMQLDWAQTLLLDLGAQDAVNLDGGPSATMVTPSQLSGQPFTRSDNSGGRRTETRVGNALILTEEAH